MNTAEQLRGGNKVLLMEELNPIETPKGGYFWRNKTSGDLILVMMVNDETDEVGVLHIRGVKEGTDAKMSLDDVEAKKHYERLKLTKEGFIQLLRVTEMEYDPNPVFEEALRDFFLYIHGKNVVIQQLVGEELDGKTDSANGHTITIDSSFSVVGERRRLSRKLPCFTQILDYAFKLNDGTVVIPKVIDQVRKIIRGVFLREGAKNPEQGSMSFRQANILANLSQKTGGTAIIIAGVAYPLIIEKGEISIRGTLEKKHGECLSTFDPMGRQV